MQFPCSEVTIAGDMLERREGRKQGEESEARDQTAGGQTRYKRGKEKKWKGITMCSTSVERLRPLK